MKKLILLVVAIALISVNSNAQDESTDMRDDVHFGVKAGINLSNIYDTEGNEYDAEGKIGLAIGGFLQIPIGTYLGFEPELLFSQKGYRSTGSVLGASYEFTHTENFIDVPLLISIKPSPFLTILAGPQFSFLMSQKDVFTSGDLTVDQEKEFENDNLRKNTLCFLGGVNINLTNIVIGARAGWDIQDNKGDGTSTNPRYKNVWYQATVGFRF